MRPIRRIGSTADILLKNILREMKKYNKPTGKYLKAKELLGFIYSKICPYCMSNVEHSSYSEIEHFYPKKKYSLHATGYRNLHFSCKVCNTLKGKKDTHKLNILSPNYYVSQAECPSSASCNWLHTGTSYVERSLYYSGFMAMFTDDLGRETIKIFDLNNAKKKRAVLLEERARAYKSSFVLLEALCTTLEKAKKNFECINILSVENLIKQLLLLTGESSPYSSMIVHNFGEEIVNLIEVWLRIKKNNGH